MTSSNISIPLQLNKKRKRKIKSISDDYQTIIQSLRTSSTSTTTAPPPSSHNMVLPPTSNEIRLDSVPVIELLKLALKEVEDTSMNPSPDMELRLKHLLVQYIIDLRKQKKYMLYQQRISNSILHLNPHSDTDNGNDLDYDEFSETMSDSEREYQFFTGSLKRHNSSPNKVHQLRLRAKRHSDRSKPNMDDNYYISPSQFRDLDESSDNNQDFILDDVDRFDEEIYQYYQNFGEKNYFSNTFEERCPAPDPYSTLCHGIMVENND